MLKNIIQRTPVEIIERSIEFTDGDGCGFSFDCDENGTPKFSCDAAKQNYEYAMAHPECFTGQFNKVVIYKRKYVEPAHGICRCGEDVTLYDEYQGACACPKCGQWYNMYGQELIDPEYWED